MNHVPDEVLDAVDAFGEGLLTGTPPRVDGRLRSWGVDPPEAYTYAGTVDGVHRYDGALGVP